MLIMSRHRLKARAELARGRDIRTQSWYDRLLVKRGILPEMPFPPAEQIYRVTREGKRWLVVVDDPSQP